MGLGSEEGFQKVESKPIFSVGYKQELGGRTDQEDKIFVSGKNPLWILADGMGAHESGEMASDILVTKFKKGEGTLSPVKIIEDANLSINNINKAQGIDSGSTVVALAIAQQQGQQVADISWVGDSPAYVYTPDSRYNQRYWEPDSPKQELSLVTQAHSLVEAMTAVGQDTSGVGKNVIYRSVGEKSNVQVDTREVPVKPGDVLLLCSDGLEEGGVTTERIKEVLAKVSRGEMTSQEAASLLTSQAKNGPDNVSVIVVKVEKELPSSKTEASLPTSLSAPGVPEKIGVNVGGKLTMVTPLRDKERLGKGYYYDEKGMRIVVDLEPKPPVWHGVVKGDNVVLETEDKELSTGWKLDGYDTKTGEAILIKKYLGGYMETRKIARDVLNNLNNPYKKAEDWSRIFIAANQNKPEISQAVRGSLWEASVGGKASLISASEAIRAIGEAGLRADPSSSSTIQEVFETYKKFEDRSIINTST